MRTEIKLVQSLSKFRSKSFVHETLDIRFLSRSIFQQNLALVKSVGSLNNDCQNSRFAHHSPNRIDSRQRNKSRKTFDERK